MANDSWIGGYQGNWTSGSNWSTGAAPGSADDVTIASSEPLISSNVGTVRSVTLGNVTNNNGSTYGTLDLSNGGALAVSGAFTNNGEVDFDPASGSGGSSLTVGGTLTNSFYFVVGNQTIAAPETVTVGALVNAGVAADIVLTGSSTVASTLNVNAAAGFGQQGVLTGRVDLYGDAVIRFASGTITSIGSGGALTLGANAAILAGTTGSSALALSSNAGTLTLGSGAALSTPGALANGGMINVGQGGTTQSTLTVNSAPGFGTAGMVDGAVSIGPYGNIAFTQAGQLTGIAADSSLLISNATPFTAAGSANGVLALASLSGPIGVYGVSITNNAAVMTLGRTGAISLANGGSLTQAGSIVSGGAISIQGASLTVNGTLTTSTGAAIGTQTPTFIQPTVPAAGTSILNAGSISLTGGQITLGSSANVTTSNVLLSNNAILDLGGPANSLSSTIGFAGGAGATLRIEAAEVPASGGAFANTVAGFANGDTINLRSLSYVGGATTARYAGTTLTVTNGSSTDTLTLSNPGGTSFVTSADGSGGTNVAVVCYAPGTLIRIARGGAEVDVAVEALAVGDLAVTAAGAHRPIRWVGSRVTRCRRHLEPHNVLPVRIRAGAFAPTRPARDLVVSPGHALCVDVCGEVLIPAIALVNGATIVQEEADAVTYWHVELDGHDILLAENMPAESYLEMGNRGFFSTGKGGGRVTDLAARPDADEARRDHAAFCRPFVTKGVLVDAVREQLNTRAAALGWSLDLADPLAGLHLVVGGERVAPAMSGMAAHFALPPRPGEAWLVSDAARPYDVGAGMDLRRLGLRLRGLALVDGSGGRRAIALDDPRLDEGWHAVEEEAGALTRWTGGRARLPAALWDGVGGAATLVVDLARYGLPRWTRRDAALRRSA